MKKKFKIWYRYYLAGFCKLFDAIIRILSFGLLYSDTELKYILSYQKKDCEKRIKELYENEYFKNSYESELL